MPSAGVTLIVVVPLVAGPAKARVEELAPHVVAMPPVLSRGFLSADVKVVLDTPFASRSRINVTEPGYTIMLFKFVLALRVNVLSGSGPVSTIVVTAGNVMLLNAAEATPNDIKPTKLSKSTETSECVNTELVECVSLFLITYSA